MEQQLQQKKPRRPDRRIQKTKRAIKKAFISLLLMKNYSKITIKDIATEADVDRKTVYNYYSSRNEIREEIENELISSIEEAVAKFEYGDTATYAKMLFGAITSMISQNTELFSYLFGNDNTSKMVRKIINYVKINVLKMLNDSKIQKFDDESLETVSTYIAGGTIVTYRNWFCSEKKVPLNELTDDLTTAAIAVVSAFKKER